MGGKILDVELPCRTLVTMLLKGFATDKRCILILDILNRCAVVVCCGFNLHFPMTNDAEHFFLCLFIFCILFWVFGKVIKSFAPYLKIRLFSYYWDFSVLYIF